MKFSLYNTLGREMQEFIPVKAGEAGIYACGPTVYNYAHIGNLRMYITEDLLVRALSFLGYKVKHVMNITDVGHLTDDADEGEDKMLKSSRETGKSVWEIAQYYTDAFWEDTKKLNIQKPNIACRATDHVQDMIDLIKVLEEKGYTYLSGGNVYFDVSKFPRYGELALLDRQNLKAGARIEVDRNKRNAQDFVLWFTKSKFEHQTMLWDSPWGQGYPGWHIECSAMSIKYLGEEFDIHCGGIDHIPVHHTNEIAQSEAATGKRWVRYWVHGEFLILDKGKMAKSSGNFLTLSSIIDRGYHPLDYRFFCLGGHYRSQLQFSFEALDSARAGRENLVQKLRELRSFPGTGTNPKVQSYLASFKDKISQDLNIPQALADLWALIKDNDIPPGDRAFGILEMDKVLGLDLSETSAPLEVEELEEECRKLLEERELARKNKDFAKADEIRKILLSKNILVRDTPAGPKWTRSV